jgi:hypothetical protein
MKTWEMIKMLSENPKLRFKCSGSGSVIIRNGGFLMWKHTDGRTEHASMIFDTDWQLVRTPVTWQEAVQAILDGKTVICMCEGCYYCERECEGYGGCTIDRKFTYTLGTGRPCWEQFRTGTWYIED